MNALYKAVRKKRGKAKIVLVRDRSCKKNGLALLSTYVALTEEEIIRIYGKRF